MKLPPLRWPKLTLLLMGSGFAVGRLGAGGGDLKWSELAPLPDAEGFAGMYAGVVGDTLIAAGGTQFAGGVPWWQGGVKRWSDAIMVYSFTSGNWRIAPERLPAPRADGVSVSYREEMICAGGGDASKATAEVFSLRWKDGALVRTPLPELPAPCVKMAGVLLGDVLYVAGGRPSPNSTSVLRTFWALDLARPRGERTWRALPPWPGPARMMPIMATSDGALYLIGGVEIFADERNQPRNRAPYLSDVFRYVPGRGDAVGQWERLADTPRPLAGAPSPACTTTPGEILIAGGVDGSIEAIVDRSTVRALPDAVLRYEVRTGKWSEAGTMPAKSARVNGPAIVRHADYLIISGENLPARRTPSILHLAPARE